MNAAAVPLWVEVIMAVLLLGSAVFAIVGALGIVRMQDYFHRLHPTALIFTWAIWSVSLASVLFFSVSRHSLQLWAWLIIILFVVTAPITTVLLSRTGLFRARLQQMDVEVPAPLQPMDLPEAATKSAAAAPEQPPG